MVRRSCTLRAEISQQRLLAARAFLQRLPELQRADARSVLYLGVQIEDELGDDGARTDYSNRILREFPQSHEAKRVLESD